MSLESEAKTHQGAWWRFCQSSHKTVLSSKVAFVMNPLLKENPDSLKLFEKLIVVDFKVNC